MTSHHPKLCQQQHGAAAAAAAAAGLISMRFRPISPSQQKLYRFCSARSLRVSCGIQRRGSCQEALSTRCLRRRRPVLVCDLVWRECSAREAAALHLLPVLPQGLLHSLQATPGPCERSRRMWQFW